MKELVSLVSMSHYYTEFSCKSLDGRGQNLEMGKGVCFARGGSGFSKFLGNQEISINIYKGQKIEGSSKYNHYCIFSLEEILNHIEALHLVMSPDEFKFIELKEDTEKQTITIQINSDSRVIFAFILTWIRYLWEFPYILATKESINLKEIFPELDPFTRFNLARASLPSIGTIWGTGHSACKRPGKLYTIDQLKSNLHSLEVTCLNNLYPSPDPELKNKIKEIDYKSEKYNGREDLEFWSMTEFKNRIEIYKNNLKAYEKTN